MKPNSAVVTVVTSDAEKLEARARSRLESAARQVLAAGRNAFPDRNDPMEIYTEAIVNAATQSAYAAIEVNQAAAERLSSMLSAFAASRDVPASTTCMEPPEDADDSCDGQGVIASTSKRSQLVLVMLTVAIAGAGAMVEHWRVTAGQIEPTLTSLSALQSTAMAARADLLASDAALRTSFSHSQAGLEVLSRIAALPERERIALNAVITELATNPGSEAVAQLASLFALPIPTRDAALAFAERGTPALRADFVSIADLAASRPFRGDSLHTACLTGGPSYRLGGQFVSTCLVQIPGEWGESDNGLRQYYTHK